MEDLARRREESARYLCGRLSEIGGLEPQWRDPRITQYAYHLFISRNQAEASEGLHRDDFLAALTAEGIPCSRGHVPLYRTNAIQTGTQRLNRFVGGEASAYRLPDCPVTELACDEEGVRFTQSMLLGATDDMDDIAAAVAKIKDNVHELLD